MRNFLFPLLVSLFLLPPLSFAGAGSTMYGFNPPGTKANPVTFYCHVHCPSEPNGICSDTSEMVTMLNYATMATGFIAGKLEIPVANLNQVYFETYYDNSKPKYKNNHGSVAAFISKATYHIGCYPGKGGRANLMPGPYGKPK